jgi:putative transposase
MSVLNELKQRGVADVLIACVDGRKGFAEAIEAVFPNTWAQTCIVHCVPGAWAPSVVEVTAA